VVTIQFSRVGGGDKNQFPRRGVSLLRLTSVGHGRMKERGLVIQETREIDPWASGEPCSSHFTGSVKRIVR